MPSAFLSARYKSKAKALFPSTRAVKSASFTPGKVTRGFGDSFTSPAGNRAQAVRTNIKVNVSTDRNTIMFFLLVTGLFTFPPLYFNNI